MGYYLIFEIKKSILKKEMRSVIRNGARNYIVIKVFNVGCNKDFHRVEKNEILYKGNLYDVISETRSGASSIFYCIHDAKEEFLLVGFKKICKNSQVVSLYENLIKVALPKMIFSEFCQTLFTLHKFPQYLISLNSRVILPLNPPPEPTG